MRFARSKDESIVGDNWRLPGFISNATLAGNDMIEFPLGGMRMVRVRGLTGGDAEDLDRERMSGTGVARGIPAESFRDLLPAPWNFPLGEAQVSSSSWSLLIFFMGFGSK